MLLVEIPLQLPLVDLSLPKESYSQEIEEKFSMLNLSILLVEITHLTKK